MGDRAGRKLATGKTELCFRSFAGTTDNLTILALINFSERRIRGIDPAGNYRSAYSENTLAADNTVFIAGQRFGASKIFKIFKKLFTAWLPEVQRINALPSGQKRRTPR